MKGHVNCVSSVAFSSDGMWIVSGSFNDSVRVWDTTTGVVMKMLEGHSDIVTSVAFSKDGTQIVSGSFDNSVRIWDTTTGVVIKVLKGAGHSKFVTSVAYSNCYDSFHSLFHYSA